MTFENRTIFSLVDVKAIVFECTHDDCGARISLKPEGTKRPPDRCPQGHSWDWNTYLNFNSTESPFIAFLSSLGRLREVSDNLGMRMFLEIEQSNLMRSTSQKSEQAQ